MKPLLLTHPDCEKHERPGHPERPDRLRSVMQLINQSGMAAECQVQLASPVTTEQLLRVHPASYLTHIADSEPRSGVIALDPDTYMSAGSSRAASLAAGACAEAVTRVISGEFQRAFCAIRPPGHHAELAEAMGFCLYNNIAIGAMTALQSPGIERVAILDFDVHHCNGTVDIFKDDDRVLVCSSFQADYYPFRYLDYQNSHTINTPLPDGSDGSVFRRLIEASWLPAIDKHKPDLILISAGFDAHRDDPLAGINLTEADFTWVTRLIIGAANEHCGGRIISSLEGGYNLDSLSRSAGEHLKALISDQPS